MHVKEVLYQSHSMELRLFSLYPQGLYLLFDIPSMFLFPKWTLKSASHRFNGY
jgi:hypothetical protein